MSTEMSATPTIDSKSDSTPTVSNGENEAAGSALLKKSEDEPDLQTTSWAIVSDSALAGLPLQLDVTVPVPGFRVGDLLALEKGTVIESLWPHLDDVPVWCGGTQLVWTEFEVVDQKLAVRVTRIS
jgi:flagellar motor switch/type III secretory pathway protein FliN